MKERIIYACQSCGQQYSKWMGRCQECGEWSTVTEERETPSPRTRAGLGLSSGQAPIPITEVDVSETDRVSSGIGEFDRVLGGGLVPGSVVLVGGEPGIGKSTLLLQAADHYARAGKTVLYVSGEESTSQLALRATRLGVESKTLLVVAETALGSIRAHVEKRSPDLLVLDSVQTIYNEAMDSPPGSLGQLRDCTHQIVSLAKRRQMASFLVGHVTKEGHLAGPKLLEHMVDVVLAFEGTSSQIFRLVRTSKNRFGSTNEIGVFEMTGRGLVPVTNPSQLFLSEKPQTIAGSVVTASIEGTRTLLVEVQALVARSSLVMPRRTSMGLDPQRVSLLAAILERRAGLRLFDQDIFVNVAGGLELKEPATDLAVVAALVSSFSGRSVDHRAVFFGEVGLGGEVRSVPKAALRLKEAARIGMHQAYVPRKVRDELKDSEGMDLVVIEHVRELRKLADFEAREQEDR